MVSMGVAFTGDGTVSEERLNELLSHPQASEFGLGPELHGRIAQVVASRL